MRFFDFRAPAARQLAELDVFVLASRWEAFPISVLEAMACGVPQLATDVGGTGEAVSEGETGSLCPPDDPAALAAAAIALLRAPERRAAMAAASRVRHDERFGVDRMVAATAALYRSLALVSTDPATPIVAVLIPCYMDGALVTEAVDSVREDEPFELVVIDDCSPDELTQGVMNELSARGVTVIRQEVNRGVAAARNAGLHATTAPYVFALDSDDLACAGILAWMADLLDAHPEADLAYGDYREFGESDSLREVPLRLDPFRLLYTNEYPQTAMFRRTLLDSLGGWDEYRVGKFLYEDWALWLTLASRGATGITPARA